MEKCAALGVQISTAWTEGSRRTPSTVVEATPNAPPNASAAPALRPAMAAISTCSTRRSASRCTRPMKPVPMMAVRIGLVIVICDSGLILLLDPGELAILCGNVDEGVPVVDIESATESGSGYRIPD